MSSVMKRDVIFVAGAAGVTAVALIAITSATTIGPLVLVPYAALAVATMLYLKSISARSLGRRFAVAFAAAMLATLSLHLFITTGGNPAVSQLTLAGHLSRLGAAAAIAGVACAAIALPRRPAERSV